MAGNMGQEVELDFTGVFAAICYMYMSLIISTIHHKFDSIWSVINTKF